MLIHVREKYSCYYLVCIVGVVRVESPVTTMPKIICSTQSNINWDFLLKKPRLVTKEDPGHSYYLNIGYDVWMCRGHQSN